jgi:hypothetical protein
MHSLAMLMKVEVLSHLLSHCGIYRVILRCSIKCYNGACKCPLSKPTTEPASVPFPRCGGSKRNLNRLLARHGEDRSTSQLVSTLRQRLFDGLEYGEIPASMHTKESLRLVLQSKHNFTASATVFPTLASLVAKKGQLDAALNGTTPPLVCSFPGCEEPRRADGVNLEFCGRMHASQAAASEYPPTPAGPLRRECALRTCLAPVALVGGRATDYCCRQHAAADAVAVYAPPQQPPLPLPTCALPGCVASLPSKGRKKKKFCLT